MSLATFLRPVALADEAPQAVHVLLLLLLVGVGRQQHFGVTFDAHM